MSGPEHPQAIFGFYSEILNVGIMLSYLSFKGPSCCCINKSLLEVKGEIGQSVIVVENK